MPFVSNSMKRKIYNISELEFDVRKKKNIEADIYSPEITFRFFHPLLHSFLAKINMQRLYSCRSRDDIYSDSLFLAIENNEPEIVQYIISEKLIDINRGRDLDGFKPFFRAIENENKEIINLFLNAGTLNLNDTVDGNSPIAFAILRNKFEVANNLIHHLTRNYFHFEHYEFTKLLNFAIEKKQKEMIISLINIFFNPKIVLNGKSFFSMNEIEIKDNLEIDLTVDNLLLIRHNIHKINISLVDPIMCENILINRNDFVLLAQRSKDTLHLTPYSIDNFADLLLTNSRRTCPLTRKEIKIIPELYEIDGFFSYLLPSSNDLNSIFGLINDLLGSESFIKG